jgi:hypothetical protein
MCAKIPRLAASRMNASSSTSKIAITGHAASVTVRPMSSSAWFGALADDHDRGVEADGSRERGDSTEARVAHDLMAEARHGVRDLFESMPLPV